MACLQLGTSNDALVMLVGASIRRPFQGICRPLDKKGTLLPLWMPRRASKSNPINTVLSRSDRRPVRTPRPRAGLTSAADSYNFWNYTCSTHWRHTERKHTTSLYIARRFNGIARHSQSRLRGGLSRPGLTVASYRLDSKELGRGLIRGDHSPDLLELG